jgi:DNA segregation ATPase FtsK/SpoIIIE, S-DNA-T family
MDMLERRNVISGYEGPKPRQVLITESDVPRVLAALAERGDVAPQADVELPPALPRSDDDTAVAGDDEPS